MSLFVDPVFPLRLCKEAKCDDVADRAEIDQQVEDHVRELKAHEEKDDACRVADTAGEDQPESDRIGLGIQDREAQHDHPAHQ